MVGSNVSFCVDGVQVHLFVRSRRWFEGSENYWVSSFQTSGYLNSQLLQWLIPDQWVFELSVVAMVNSRGWLEPNVFEISFQIRRLRYFWDFDFGLKVEDD
ncbi:hypothetical protein U1Q18_044608 [Sarracenia purpurea var. burkii]